VTSSSGSASRVIVHVISSDWRRCKNRRTAASRSSPIAISYAWRASPFAPVLASN
jgi:hypothetical protein